MPVYYCKNEDCPKDEIKKAFEEADKRISTRPSGYPKFSLTTAPEEDGVVYCPYCGKKETTRHLSAGRAGL